VWAPLVSRGISLYDCPLMRERPRLTVISAEVPAEQSTSGFAPRLRRFLVAAGTQMDVTLALVDRSSDAIAHADPGPVRDVRVLRSPPAVWRERGLRGRLTRAIVQYPLDPLPFEVYPRRSPELRQLLVVERPDVIVVYLPYLLGVLRECPADVPVVAALEERWEWVVAGAIGDATAKDAWLGRRETARFRRLYRRVGPRLAAAVAISEAEREYFGAMIPRDKITVIPHAIDTAYYSPSPTGRRERDIDVLVVGKLRARHNLDGALRTWEAARDRGWRWAFVGEIDDRAAARLREAGSLVPGAVPDTRPYYDRARCVLVPALTGRGVKTTSLQTWAMDCPLVASPVGARGLPAVPGENLLVGADPPALAQHLATVLADPELAGRLGAAGRSTAVRECDASRLDECFVTLCLRAAASGQRSGGRSSSSTASVS
jgi:glycosyltransferase involved in cell wall biosynthesis